MLAWLLFNALVASALLAVETYKARRRVRWLLAQPLTYWQWRESNRRVMASAHKAMLGSAERILQSFAEGKRIAADGDTVKFRRPAPFKE
jgi:hypothetical protein